MRDREQERRKAQAASEKANAADTRDAHYEAADAWARVARMDEEAGYESADAMEQYGEHCLRGDQAGERETLALQDNPRSNPDAWGSSSDYENPEDEDGPYVVLTHTPDRGDAREDVDAIFVGTKADAETHAAQYALDHGLNEGPEPGDSAWFDEDGNAVWVVKVG